MRIGIFTNQGRDPDLVYTRQACQIIQDSGAELCLDQELARALSYASSPYTACDLMISFGGDGTFLAMTHLPGLEEVPMIGVNLGSVGFLPIIEPHHLARDLARILRGEGHSEERMRLEYTHYSAAGEILAEGLALNDVVVHRGANRSIITADLWINGDAVERVPGDGLIVATPTGSTAYTLSAGGPIVHPTEQVLIVTAICPHTLHNRSYLAGADSEVRVALPKRGKEASLSADGREPVPMKPGEYLVIRQANRPLKMLRLGRDNFYETLAEKIQKRGISK